MYKFSISKYFFFLLLVTLVNVVANDSSEISNFFANLKTKSNDSSSLALFAKADSNLQTTSLKLKISAVYSTLSVEQKESNLKIQSSVTYSSTFLNQLIADFRSEFSKNISSNSINSLDTNANFTILVNNELCDLLGIKLGAVLPNSLLSNNSNAPIILLSDLYDVSTIESALTFLSSSSSKNEKKFATDPEAEDLRLRINILFFDKDLVQFDELALNPTTVTTASSTKFRAKGGTSDYLWRLIPADGSDAKISSNTGSDITYTAGSTESRAFDVLILMDGLEEVSINIVVAKVRLENDGSGSKGGGCFIRQKYRD